MRISERTTCEQIKKSWMIYCSGNLAMEQDELVAQPPHALNRYAMTENATVMTFRPYECPSERNQMNKINTADGCR